MFYLLNTMNIRPKSIPDETKRQEAIAIITALNSMTGYTQQALALDIGKAGGQSAISQWFGKTPSAIPDYFFIKICKQLQLNPYATRPWLEDIKADLNELSDNNSATILSTDEFELLSAYRLMKTEGKQHLLHSARREVTALGAEGQLKALGIEEEVEPH